MRTHRTTLLAVVRCISAFIECIKKALSFFRGVEGQRVLEATLTVMTETGEVATSLWTHSTSLEVVKDNLRQIYERMAAGGRPVRPFCSTNLSLVVLAYNNQQRRAFDVKNLSI